MITNEFIIGFAFGALITLLFGWVWLLYRDWVKARDAYNRPQIVIQPTPKTPAQVRSAANQAELKILLIRLALLLMVWLFIEVMFPDAAQFVHDIFRALWQMLWGP